MVCNSWNHKVLIKIFWENVFTFCIPNFVTIHLNYVMFLLYIVEKTFLFSTKLTQRSNAM